MEPESHDLNDNDDDDSNMTEIADSIDKSTNDEKICGKEDDNFDDMLEDALNQIRNFVPKRKRKEQQTFVDLNVEDEKHLRVKSRGAPYYWHMPFRHNLFLKGINSNDGNSSDEEENVTEKGNLGSQEER